MCIKIHEYLAGKVKINQSGALLSNLNNYDPLQSFNASVAQSVTSNYICPVTSLGPTDIRKYMVVHGAFNSKLMI